MRNRERPRERTTVADLSGGEIIRVASGIYRITRRPPWHGTREGIYLVGNPPQETRSRVALAFATPVLEVLVDQHEAKGQADDELDPLLRRLP